MEKIESAHRDFVTWFETANPVSTMAEHYRPYFNFNHFAAFCTTLQHDILSQYGEVPKVLPVLPTAGPSAFNQAMRLLVSHPEVTRCVPIIEAYETDNSNETMITRAANAVHGVQVPVPCDGFTVFVDIPLFAVSPYTNHRDNGVFRLVLAETKGSELFFKHPLCFCNFAQLGVQVHNPCLSSPTITVHTLMYGDSFTLQNSMIPI